MKPTKEKCKECNGTGKILIRAELVWDHEDVQHDHYVLCWKCKTK